MKKIYLIATALALPLFVDAATMSISPATQSVHVGDTFTVSININTSGATIDGVDIRYLNYNPALLEVQDADSTTAGVQIAPGALMPVTVANSVNASTGKILFSQVVMGGGGYSGSGTLATITFKALAVGTANITIDSANGATTDTNIASAGNDTLTSATGASYTISAATTGTTGGTTGGTSGGTNVSSGGGGGGGGGAPINSINNVSNIGVSSSLVGASSSTPINPSINTTSCSPKLSLNQIASILNLLKAFNADQSIIDKVDSALSCPNKLPTNNSQSVANANSSTFSYTFTRSLTLGSVGIDVKMLQIFLNTHNFIITTTGPGSPGNESTYFGALTKQALIRYQNANRSTILTPAGLTQGTGFFGASTMRVVNSISEI